LTKTTDRRVGLLFALFLGLFTLATLRAGWLGVVRGDSLKGRAVAQQVQEMTVPARRGAITDRNGVDLAVSEDAVTVFANPFLIKDPTAAAQRVAALVNRPYAEVLSALANRRRGFVYLARKLDPSVDAKVKALHIAGIGTMTEPKRLYPRGTLAAQLLGSVGTDNWGLAGLEQLREKSLHGSDGKERIVKDGAGQPISIVEQKRSEPGKDLRLTIDSVIQQKAEDVLAGVGQTYRPKGATAVVMDPRNGEILALANWPQVNPNDLGTSTPDARQDRAVSVNYEPGSTFKAVTVSGALESRLITPGTSFDLPPTIQVADRVIKEAHDRGYETLTTGQILAQSSNVGAVKIGLMLGKQRFDHWVRRFGFGTGTGVDIPGEQAGIVPKPSQYSGSSLGNLPIGQGLAVTPMQMAAAYEAIADGGVMHRPHVIMGDPTPAHRVISARTATQVSRMLEGVLGPGGTAEEAKVAGYTLAGKTGTAQKPDGMGGYSKFKFVASFIGYAPARDPRLLVAVMVDEPQGDIYGGTVAAPAFEKIVSFALPYLRIPPG
jgi:cell division protein FtsI (penicillin-binding protein 3)